MPSRHEPEGPPDLPSDDPRWAAAAWTRCLLDTWRQVSEHLDIGACCDELWPRLHAAVGVSRLWVRRIDLLEGHVETVAVAPWERSLSEIPSRHELDAPTLDAVRRLAEQVQVDRLPRRIERVVVPARQGEPPLAAPLVDGDTVIGVALFDGPHELRDHRALLQALLAPLVAALRNDQRVHELARLREAVEADNRALLSRLARDGIAGALVGARGGLRDVMAQVQRVSQTEAPVLLLGETGTGKELIAREIHARSPRTRGPFLKVNCGAIPADLIDSELFGHEKGSFTGAVGDRRGWFERADGGTLFLDEIGELPAAAQVRLLRVLQDGSFERVGGQRPLHADVRIVAATHRDLAGMVGDGRFREDLWYRIGVFPIRLPPLRERMGDLPDLVAHFASRTGERLRGRALAATRNDLRLLASYAWPGNVRELGSVIERAAILGDGQHLDVRTALGVQADAAPRALPLPETSADRTATRPQRSTFDDVNRAVIEDALRASAGKVEGRGGAASRLGLHPSTLRSRMKRLGIDWRAFRPGGEERP